MDFVYTHVIFDDETILSTNPLTSSTHWNIPLFRAETRKYEKDSSVTLDFQWDNPADINTYKWSLEK